MVAVGFINAYKDNLEVDESDDKYAVGQNDPNVWFLVSTGGGEATRACTILADYNEQYAS